MNKNIFIAVSVLLIGAVAFYGGLKYGQNSRQNIFSQNFNGSALNGNVNAGGMRGARFSGGLQGGAASGEIIGKDETSITIKLRDGGSKIIFFSDSTKITKTVDGAQEDLTQGIQILASGEENSDKSIIAKTIQIMPFLPDAAVPKPENSEIGD